ncbi:MAG: nucleoside recognition domain-containing protein [Bacillota bacterium]|nr:nucleoside recognition domain-containing protein [Bacillota bacterium]
MNSFSSALRNGGKSGWQTMWTVVKIVVPIYFATRLLDALGWLAVFAGWLEPLMGLLGLPGEAALPLVLGAAINIYSLLGALAAIEMTVRQITILSAITLVAHSLFLEGAICAKSNVNIVMITVLRIGLALLLGMALNWLLPV